jgi:integrase
MTTSFNLFQPYDVTVINDVKQRKPANRECRVYLVFSLGRGKQKRFKTDFRVNAQRWDFDRQRIKSQAPNSVRLNKRLDELKSSFADAYNKLMDNDPKPTFSELVKQLEQVVITGTLPAPEPEQTKCIFDVIDEYIAINSARLNEDTIAKFPTLKRRLRQFEEKTGEKVTFEKIDLLWYDRFVSFLHSIKNIRTGTPGLAGDTQAKYIETLKQLMRWSYRRNFHTNNVFNDKEFSSSRQQKVEIIVLSETEVQTLIDLDLSNNERLEKVKDLFVFMIHTGQRWSDYEDFNPAHVENDEWLLQHDDKTGKPHVIPLYEYGEPAMDILKKYNGDIPRMSNQEFNRVLKEVCALAGFDYVVEKQRKYSQKKTIIKNPKYAEISAHTARRTCITRLLEGGMPPTTVMLLTGHSDIRTMWKYVGRNMDTLRTAYRRWSEGKKEKQSKMAV